MSNPAPKKSLGQHWLNDEFSLEAMCESSAVQSDDTVLEIGPGPGALTKLLVEKASHVVAIEFDEHWARQLPINVPAENLEVQNHDILSFDFTSLPQKYKVIANIPYYLTSHLIRVLSETPNPPQSATILIQKEVAERVVAKPGGMSLLSITAQYYWQVELGEEVPAELFTPPPKVDSQILVMQYRSTPLFTDIDTKTFFRIVKAGFSQKRKTLLNSLSAGLHLDKESVKEFCEAVNIDPRRRAQTLSLDEWHDLYSQINP